MKEYRCLRCEYRFCSENGIPYCPACDCESLEEIEDDFILEKEKLESHHIHPKFMNNPKGLGQQYCVTKTRHDILHGLIMKWIWEEICDEEKQEIIKVVINKSKKFIGVSDDTKTA